MALQKNYNKFGVLFSSAYHRIESIRVNKNEIQIDLNIYSSINDTNEAIESKTFFKEYQDNWGSLHDGYEYLKTLSEYSDSIDV